MQALCSLEAHLRAGIVWVVCTVGRLVPLDWDMCSVSHRDCVSTVPGALLTPQSELLSFHTPQEAQEAWSPGLRSIWEALQPFGWLGMSFLYMLLVGSDLLVGCMLPRTTFSNLCNVNWGLATKPKDQ